MWSSPTIVRGVRARLDQHDLFALVASRLQCPHQARGVPDAFEIRGDDARAVVAGEGVEIIGEADNGLVAAADQVAETEAGTLHHGEDCRADAAALCHHRDRTGAQRVEFR